MAGIVVRWGSDLARSTTEAGGRLTCLIPPLLPAGAIRDSAFRSPGRSGLESPRPRECRTLHVQRFAGNFLDGASRTRTGGLLGAIQGAQCLNVSFLQGVSGTKRQPTEPRIIRNLRDFPRVLARGGVRVAKPRTALATAPAGTWGVRQQPRVLAALRRHRVRHPTCSARGRADGAGDRIRRSQACLPAGAGVASAAAATS